MSRYLFTSDLHLTEEARDAYRWDIFRWLEVQAANRKVDVIFVLGDITDLKDKHSNRLINMIVDAFWRLHKNSGARVRILRGNHDGSDPANPLLHFLRRGSSVRFCPDVLCEDDYAMIAHQRGESPFLAKLKEVQGSPRFLLIHQTMKHSVTSTGYAMEHGFSGKRLRLAKEAAGIEHVISGDIHVPQKRGPLLYCGSPHPVHFGDEFEPRVLFWDGSDMASLKRHTLRKLTLKLTGLEQLKETEINKGDQVKVVYSLPRAAFGTWVEVREELIGRLEELGAVVCGVKLHELANTTKAEEVEAVKTKKSPRSMLHRFCKARKIDPHLTEVGERLLNGES